MIGKVLGDRYEIIEKVGGGGMAIVYKAKCRLLNRYVAVKVLRDEFTNDEEFIKKFRHESQAAASLSHPNIVNIYDVGSEGNIYYIVMEYIKGKTLKEIIQEKGKLSPEETIDYSIQIAEALQHAHNNHIVHRDIKPHNIMVTEDGRVKVTDFGIARAVTSTTMTNTSSVIGSVHYFSPEQARGRYTDEKSDIYSLGIVMYEMITGKVPFEGESPISIALKHVEEEIVPPREVDSSVPENIEFIIRKCVRKNQIERYKNAGELLRDLRRIKYSKGEIDFTEDTNEFDSATRIIPVVDSRKDTVDTMGNKKTTKGKKNRTNGNDGNKKIVFWAILAAFLAATGLFLATFKFKGLFGSSEIEVPEVINLHEDVAKEKVESKGLKFVVRSRINDPDVKEGYVIFQSVDPGTKVKKNYPIEVDISLGGELAKVPKLEGRDITEVDGLLEGTGLSEVVKYENSDTVPRNIIISQDPEPYTEVPEGTRINLIVSLGPETKTTIVPNLIGLKENEAKRALIANQLKLGEPKQEYNNDVPKGEVIFQSIQSGKKVEINTAVNITVSKGPEEKSEDNPNTGNETVVIPIKVTLPQDREQTEVKIYRNQDGKTDLIHNEVYNISEGSIVINVEGKPNAKFDVYFDDIYQGTQPN